MRRALIIIVLLVVTLVAAGKDGRELINAEVMATAQCRYVVRPAEQSFTARGGAGSLAVFAAETCTWTPTSNAPWITIGSFTPGSALGPGRVNYTVLPNTEVNQRTGTIAIAGQTFTVSQAGVVSTGCVVTPINTGQSVNGALTPGDCQSPLRIKDGAHPLADRYSFNAAAGQPVIISATSEDLDTYLYLLDANGSIVAQNDDSRGAAGSRIPANGAFFILPASGPFTVEVTSFASGGLGNYALSVTMPAGNCTYGINPIGQAFSTANGTGSVTVNTQAGCAWGATSNNGWLGITAALGSGQGAVNFTVAANTGVARTGTLTVAGLTFTVTQAGTNGAGCPTVGSVSPGNGPPGGAITITGTNFTGVSGVKYANNIAAQFTVIGDTQITTTVPNGAVTGPLTIIKPTCSDSQTGSVTVNALVVTASAASFAGATQASESIVAAFGVGLATGVSVANSVPLPTTLLGTTVTVKDFAGTERLAPLFFVSGGQINFQIPQGTVDGVAIITVRNGDGVVSIGTIQIARVSPGIFTASSNGQGIAAAQVFRVKGDGTQSFEPVAQFDQGQSKFVPIPIDLGPASDQVFLVLYGTGIRNRSDLSAVTATVGGVAANVLYAGAAPVFVGLDQVNLALSRSLIGRGEVVVTLTVDGRVTNPVTVTIK